MRTIRQPGHSELTDRKSRFLGALARVHSEQEAREFVRQRRRAHPDARHHCSAYVLGDGGEFQKSSDDGEPAGTAGIPMLEVLRRNEVTNTVAVVSRYFGGVLLGAGGLIRAYGSAVAQTLEHVGLAERREVRIVETTVEHAVAGRLENDLRSSGLHLTDVDYGARVRFELHMPDEEVPEFRQWLAQATGGVAVAELGGLTHVELPEDGSP